MKQLRILALTLLAGLLLAACGGGGGGGAANNNSGSTPPPINPTPDPDPDPLPFDLLSDEPGSPGIRGYINNPDIQVEFDNNGNGVAAWVADIGPAAVLRYSIFTPATGSWTPAASAIELRSARSEVHIFSGGASFAVLVIDDSKEVLTAIVANGVLSDFESLEVVSEEDIDNFFGVSDGALAASGDGYAATWQRVVRIDDVTFDRFSRLKASILSAPGAGWSDPVSIDDGEANLRSYELLGTANGYLKIWLEFERLNSGITSRLKANYNNGSGWLATPDDLGETSSSAPAAATNGSTFQIAWLSADQQTLVSQFYSADFVRSSNSVSFTQSNLSRQRLTSDGNDYLLTWQSGSDHYVSIGQGTAFTAAEQIIGAAAFTDDKVLAGDAGQWVIAWVQDGAVLATAYDGSWSDAIPVSAEDLDRVLNVSLVLENGTATLAWRQFRDSPDQIFDLFTSQFASGWSVPEQIDGGAENVGRPVLASGGGDLFLHWVQQLDDNSGAGVFVARNSGSWDEEELLNRREAGSSLGASAQPVTVLSNEAGLTMAVWAQRQGTYQVVYGAVRSDDGEWGTPEILTDTENSTLAFLNDGRVATNGESFAYVYQVDDPSPDDETDVLVRIYEDGAWSEPAAIDVGLNFQLQDARIASNGAGYLVAWTQATSESFSDRRTFGSLYEDGVWSMPVTLSDGVADSTQSPFIASNGVGYAVTWDDFRSDEVQVNVYDGSAWSGARTLLAPRGRQARPRVVSDGTGYMVTWRYRGPTDQYENLYVSLSTTGAVDDFSESTRVTEDVERRMFPIRVVGGAAGYAVAWNTNVPSTSSPLDAVALVWDGSTFSDPLPIESVEADAFVSGLAANDSGFAVLLESRDSIEAPNPRTLSATVYANGAWQENVALEDSDQPLGDDPFLRSRDITASDDSYAISWSERGNDDRFHIRFSRFDGTSWNTRQIEEQAANADAVQIGANADGTFTVMWRQADPNGSPLVRLPWAYHGLE